MTVRFPRVIPEGEEGIDVEGVGRALARYTRTLGDFNGKPKAVRQEFGNGKIVKLDKLRREHAKPTGRRSYNQADHALLTPWFDAKASKMMLDYRPPPRFVYPLTKGSGGGICQGLHPTAGVTGNWAIDFCVTPGARVVSPEDGWIYRLSGNDPAHDVQDPAGVYGWSVYVMTNAGYLYFITHLGTRPAGLRVGLRVFSGDVVGTVGDQPFRPDHVHLGVSSPLGVTDAKRRITAVSEAARIA